MRTGNALKGFYSASPRLKLDAPANGLSREKSVVAPIPCLAAIDKLEGKG
jgi:hypothetical protein